MRYLKFLFLYACWGLGLFRLTAHKTTGKLLILCYHGFQILDEAQFRPKLFISRERFERHLGILWRQRANVLPLDDALTGLYEGGLPARTVAITIDDGFASVNEVAHCSLLKCSFPATVYVTSYYALKSNPVFRLVIQYLFWKCKLDKVVLKNIAGFEYKLIDFSNTNDTEQTMWRLVRYGETQCSEEERQNLSLELSKLLDVDVGPVMSSRNLSLLTLEEIRHLSESGIDIQLHTHRHQFPTDDEIVAKREIEENRTILKSVTGKEPLHFCYPSGIWDEQQWSWLESLDLLSATTCDPGFNDVNTNRFALKRFLDGENITDIEFLAEITGFSEMLRMISRRLQLALRGQN